MYTGTSLFLIAVGAILTFAVTTSAEGFNINNAGWILMAVGALGLLISLMMTHAWTDRRRDVVVERPVREDPPAY